jgi:hypothetical protein
MRWDNILVIGGDSDGQRINLRDDMDRVRLHSASKASGFEEYRLLKLRGYDHVAKDYQDFGVVILKDMTDAQALKQLVENYHGKEQANR